jgi:allantoate deiminase
MNGNPDSAYPYAEEVMRRADTLGAISEESGCLTRRYGTAAMRQANAVVATWMREAGMSVRTDSIGNLVGRYEGGNKESGTGNSSPTADSRLPTPTPTLILGSHLDSVRDAGRYDGPLGVLVALACVQRLHNRGERPPYAIEIVAFADEEGLRFHTAYLGSKVFAGRFDPNYLEIQDADGITLEEAIRAHGGDPERLRDDARSPDDLLGYCEVHIEQGPVLEARGLPVGVVSAISGQNRFGVQFIGEAGHAGTVPMHMRHDALSGAAEFILAAESLAKGTSGLVATVGQLGVQPGASNVIPGRAALSLDVRHIDDNEREAACRKLREHADQIAEVRGLSLVWQPMQETASVPCSARLSGLLAHSAQEAGYLTIDLPSGAGHDAVTMSAITDIAMLFVRCKGGVSHNPAESVEVEDVAVAIEVMGRFLGLLEV